MPVKNERQSEERFSRGSESDRPLVVEEERR